MRIARGGSFVELRVDRISFNGGLPRFSFKRSLSGKTFALKGSKDPLRISASFMLQKDSESTLDDLLSWAQSGELVDLSIDDKSFGVVITSLSWDDDGEVIKGRIELVEADEVVSDG